MRSYLDSTRWPVIKAWMPPHSLSLLLAAAGFGAVFLLGRIWLGSAGNLVRAIQGVPVVVERRIVDLGNLPVGTRATATFNFRSLRFFSLRIVGARADCGCIVAGELPRSINGFGATTLPVTLQAGRVGVSENHLVWFLEDADGSTLPCTIRYCGVE